MSYYKYADQFPPILVRLLARHKNGPPFTTAEIAQRAVKHWYEHCGEPRLMLNKPYSEYVINSISQELTWNNIEFGAMRAFLFACDMDFTAWVSMDRKRAYMRVEFKSAKFTYLHDSPEWEYILKPLVQRYREHIASKIKQP